MGTQVWDLLPSCLVKPIAGGVRLSVSRIALKKGNPSETMVTHGRASPKFMDDSQMEIRGNLEEARTLRFRDEYWLDCDGVSRTQRLHKAC